MKLRFRVYWRTWALPFGLSLGDNDSKFHWAFSVGPFHIVHPKRGYDFEQKGKRNETST